MIVINVFVLFVFFSLSKPQNVFMPNLPLGEYRVVFEKVYPCVSTRNQSIQFNLYFNKKTTTITELNGNLIYLLPFDDTLILDVNLASWGSTGGWIPNAYVYITKNACSQKKKVLGNVWFKILKAFKVPTSSCPLPAVMYKNNELIGFILFYDLRIEGTYNTPGVDLKEIQDHNFPKVYFYGKYKVTFKVKNVNNTVLGCGVLEVNLIRPWEKPF